MTIWAGLIVSRVLRLADSLVPTGREADLMLAATTGPRLELAEPLAQAAAVHGIEIPRSDENLRLFLARQEHGDEGRPERPRPGSCAWLTTGSA